MITQHSIRNADDALQYLTECTLATVANAPKSRSKSEQSRQESIAQTGIDWIKATSPHIKAGRVDEVVNQYGGSVHNWAQGKHG